MRVLCFAAVVGVFFGTRTSSTPLLRLALALSAITTSGKVTHLNILVPTPPLRTKVPFSVGEDVLVAASIQRFLSVNETSSSLFWYSGYLDQYAVFLP